MMVVVMKSAGLHACACIREINAQATRQQQRTGRYLGFSRQWSLARLTTANLIVFWFFYYRRHIVEMPVLHFYRDFYHISLVLRSKISQTSFRPVPWLVSSWCSTGMHACVWQNVWSLTVARVSTTPHRCPAIRSANRNVGVCLSVG